MKPELRLVLFHEKDAVAAVDLRATLETAGTPLGPYDLWIVAQALRTGATLGHRERLGIRPCARPRLAGLDR
jgi:predicted nucleic acid-binding protein